MASAPRRGAGRCARGQCRARLKPCPPRAHSSTHVLRPPVRAAQERTTSLPVLTGCHRASPDLISPLLPQISRANSTSSYVSHDPGTEFSGNGGESTPGTSSPMVQFFTFFCLPLPVTSIGFRRHVEVRRARVPKWRLLYEPPTIVF